MGWEDADASDTIYQSIVNKLVLRVTSAGVTATFTNPANAKILFCRRRYQQPVPPGFRRQQLRAPAWQRRCGLDSFGNC